MVARIVCSGLPGVGKTTIARALAQETGAFYLRIDSIETGLRESTLRIHPAQDAGYLAAMAVARDNLVLGTSVIADCVNDCALTRRRWADVATGSDARLVNVEVTCPDSPEHMARVEERRRAPGGETLPDWPTVQARMFEPWGEPRLILDSHAHSPATCAARIAEALR